MAPVAESPSQQPRQDRPQGHQERTSSSARVQRLRETTWWVLLVGASLPKEHRGRIDPLTGGMRRPWLNDRNGPAARGSLFSFALRRTFGKSSTRSARAKVNHFP